MLGAIFVPETYAPILLRRRAQLLSKVTGKVYMTAVDMDHPEAFQEMLKRSMIRPWALLFREPIVLLLSVSFPQPFPLRRRLLMLWIQDIHGCGLCIS